MRVTRLVLGPLETNCWVVGDDDGGPVVVIDPADDPQAVVAAADGREIELIVLTHGHFDHLGGVRALVQSTGAPLAMHDLDAASVTTSEGNGGALFGFDASAPAPSRMLSDGDVFRWVRSSFACCTRPVTHRAGFAFLHPMGAVRPTSSRETRCLPGVSGEPTSPGVTRAPWLVRSPRALRRSIRERRSIRGTVPTRPSSGNPGSTSSGHAPSPSRPTR